MTRFLSWGAAALAIVSIGVGCVDREFISVKDETPLRPIGDACTVDVECVTGRCIAGACDDGDCGNDSD